MTGSVDSVQRMPDLVAEATTTSANNGLNGLEENNNHKSKVYASVSEMKRMKVQLKLINSL